MHASRSRIRWYEGLLQCRRPALFRLFAQPRKSGVAARPRTRISASRAVGKRGLAVRRGGLHLPEPRRRRSSAWSTDAVHRTAAREGQISWTAWTGSQPATTRVRDTHRAVAYPSLVTYLLRSAALRSPPCHPAQAVRMPLRPRPHLWQAHQLVQRLSVSR